VAQSRHRVLLEGGLFQLIKGWDAGSAFGVGYAYRPVRGLELGLGLRYFLQPDQPTDSYLPQPAGAPPERFVVPGFHYWLLLGSVRGYVPLDGADRVEVGFTLRGGAVFGSNARGNCCKEYEFALGPDVRVRVWQNTAVALAAELAVGSTGLKNGPTTEDDVDEIFLKRSLWLSVVQGF
jgi:hypothetical protein